MLMFQREVAERIVAQPGSKTYGRLSVLAGWRTRGEDPVRHRAVRLRAAAEGDLVAGAARPARRARCPATARALERVTAAAFGQRRKMLRAEPASRSASIPFRCSKTPVSTRPRARRILRSKASSRSPEDFVMTRMIRQSMTAYATPLCETVVEAPEPRGTRSAGAHQPLRRVPFRPASAGRLFQPRRRQEARRDGAVRARCPSRSATRSRAWSRRPAPTRTCRSAAVVRGVSLDRLRRNARPARRGEENLCAAPRHLGIQVDGGFATHVLVPHPRYLIDHDRAARPALAGAYMCSGLTAFSALKRIAEHARRGPVLLVGLGGVGMMGLSFARALFPHPPIVADIDAAKREAALKAGAAAAYDPADPDARKALMQGDRRRLRRGRFRRLGRLARLRDRRARQGRQGRDHRADRRHLHDADRDVSAARRSRSKAP